MRYGPHLLLACLCLSPILVPPAARADEAASWKAYAALHKLVDPLKDGDPRQAAAHFTEFFNAQADIDAWVGAKVCGEAAEVQYFRLKDVATALAVCDWGLQRWAKRPASIETVASKAKILLAEKRAEEASALFEGNWSLLTACRPDPVVRSTDIWCQALERQGKKEQVPAVMQRVLLGCPVLLDDTMQWSNGWLYDRLHERLTGAGRSAEALQWAKVRFMMCRFDTAAVERATKMLAGAFMATDPSRKASQAFAESQADPTKPNPLAEVKLPEVKPEELKARLARLQGDFALHDRVTVLLLGGDFLSAAMEARRSMVRQPGKPEGAREVCRVLKAADLNLKRANAFAAFVKAGEGENPLAQFVQEQQERGAGTGLLPLPAPAEMAELTRPLHGDDPAAALADPRPAAEAPAVISERAAALRLAVTEMAAGKLSPDAAWRSGVVAFDDAVGVLERIPLWHDEEGCVRLAGLLVQHFPERIAEAEKWNSLARWRLAKYYAGRSDARAVPLFESVLAEIKQPEPKWVQPLIDLGLYYSQVGDHQRSIDTFRRAERYSTDKEFIGDTMVEIARQHSILGEHEKTREMWAKVAQFGQIRAAAVALAEEANWLVGQGEQEKARKLLLEATQGAYPAKMQVYFACRLGQLYAKSGDPAAARKWYEQADTRFRALRPGEGDSWSTYAGQAAASALAALDRDEKAPPANAPRP